MSILIGADPEFFVSNKQGQVISAHGLVPGTKKNPYKVPFGAVQVDGMALEFNIDPADSEATFVHNVNSVMNTLKSMVPELSATITPTAFFDKAYIDAQPHEAVELGCDPDFNCYTRQHNATPDSEVTFRTAAGHIHIGWTEGMDVEDPGHFDACCMLTQQLDWFLGVPSLMFDSDKTRRELYGQMGSFRPKSYGMEYRVLSNAWLKDEDLIRWVYQNATKAFDTLAAGTQVGEKEGSQVAEFFNFEIYEEAVKVYCEHFDIQLPPEV